jgi:hypothetical protein
VAPLKQLRLQIMLIAFSIFIGLKNPLPTMAANQFPLISRSSTKTSHFDPKALVYKPFSSILSKTKAKIIEPVGFSVFSFQFS